MLRVCSSTSLRPIRRGHFRPTLGTEMVRPMVSARDVPFVYAMDGVAGGLSTDVHQSSIQLRSLYNANALANMMVMRQRKNGSGGSEIGGDSTWMTVHLTIRRLQMSKIGNLWMSSTSSKSKSFTSPLCSVTEYSALLGNCGTQST